MSVVTTLPSHPVTYAERERIRARDDVQALTVLGTASIHNRRADRTQAAVHLIVLSDETVYALEYHDTEWSKEVLQRGADQRDHLERALDQLNKS